MVSRFGYMNTDSTTTTYTQAVETGRQAWTPICTCGWRGINYRRSGTVEYRQIAERDAKDHGWAHDNGSGWFDYKIGWVNGPEAYRRSTTA